MRVVNLGIDEIIPYENNPRFNDFAVEAVVESINQVGYITPIIIDENNVVLAGHTRLKALERLGWDKVECIRLEGLTEEQKKKFRVLDNKTAELAVWDDDLLRDELSNLDLGGFAWFDDIVNPNMEPEGSTEKSSRKKDAEPDDGIVRCPKCGAVVYDPFGEDE